MKYQNQQTPELIDYSGWLTSEGGTVEEELPWGLYVNEAHKDILDWRLPTKAQRLQLTNNGNSYTANQYLVYLLEAMLFLDSKLRDQLTDKDSLLVDTNGNPLNNQQKFYIILKNLPWPIGAQFQKLIALKNFNLDRLKQIDRFGWPG